MISDRKAIKLSNNYGFFFWLKKCGDFITLLRQKKTFLKKEIRCRMDKERLGM